MTDIILGRFELLPKYYAIPCRPTVTTLAIKYYKSTSCRFTTSWHDTCNLTPGTPRGYRASAALNKGAGDELHHSDHQAAPSRPCPCRSRTDRHRGPHGERGARPRPSEGPYRGLPWRRIPGALPAQDAAGTGRRRGPNRKGGGSHQDLRAHFIHRRRQDFRVAPAPGCAHPHR